ncbi:MAG: helix-turn-helix domain-containing protein [Candidatus Magasanikbacteria bacterium]
MPSINPDEIYTPAEAEKLLKVSKSTIKRLLKSGLLKANKVGKQYRILGHEILKMVSPVVDEKATDTYQKIKTKIVKKTKDW